VGGAPDPSRPAPATVGRRFNGLSVHSDAQSKQLFEALIADGERHQDQYEKQKDNIRRFGPSYLALQAMGSSADAPKGGAGG
jgi:bacterioferritin (cytochrome b1)